MDISSTDKSAIDIKGRTAAYLAAIGGHVEVLRRLCDAGAHVTTPAFNSEPPLFAAARRGHTAVVAFLLQRQGKSAHSNPNPKPRLNPAPNCPGDTCPVLSLFPSLTLCLTPQCILLIT